MPCYRRAIFVYFVISLLVVIIRTNIINMVTLTIVIILLLFSRSALFLSLSSSSSSSPSSPSSSSSTTLSSYRVGLKARGSSLSPGRWRVNRQTCSWSITPTNPSSWIPLPECVRRVRIWYQCPIIRPLHGYRCSPRGSVQPSAAHRDPCSDIRMSRHTSGLESSLV